MAQENGKTPDRKEIDLIITTPRGVKFVEKADLIIMRAIDGDLGVLPGHEPLTTVLGDGVLRIYHEGVERKLAIFGGTAEIGPNAVRILSTIAQRPDEIDLERAQEDRLETEAAMQEELEDQMARRLQILQARALIRIHVGMAGAAYFEENGDSDESE